MRALILVAGIALSLGGCGESKDVAENIGAVAENLTVETAPPGDTTAIDAATGEDSNMAADADISLTEPAGSNAGNDERADSQ